MLFYSMSLSLGFPLILQFLVMEKEENIKHLLEVNGLKARNYWIATFVFFFVFLCLGSCLFFAVGRVVLDDAMFHKVPWVQVLLFVLLWNANQVVLSAQQTLFWRKIQWMKQRMNRLADDC